MRASPAVENGTAGVVPTAVPPQKTVAAMFESGFVPFDGGVGMTRPSTRTLTRPLRRTRASPRAMTQGASPGLTPNRTGPVGATWLPNRSERRTSPPWRWPLLPWVVPYLTTATAADARRYGTASGGRRREAPVSAGDPGRRTPPPARGGPG